VHPVGFHLGPFTVHWYGVFVAFGFLIGLWNASRRGAKVGIQPEKIYDIGLWLIVGGILGGRIVHVITYWQSDYANKPIWEIFAIHHGGLVYYGGLIGASLGGILYARVKKLPVWKLADVLAPSLALGYAIGRIGCLMNGCCYGERCDLPWAIRFPQTHDTHGALVHPTQIYESLLNLILFVAMARFFWRRKFDGHVFGVYLMCYAIARSIVEVFRGDYSAQHIHAGLTPAHIVSIGIFIAGLVLIWKLPRTVPKRG
jgi:phosphatidylglycerol---prolipoprotein diacylglyceryl transferase